MKHGILGSSWLIEGLLYISQFQYNNQLSRTLDTSWRVGVPPSVVACMYCLRVLTKCLETKHPDRKALSGL